MALIVAFSFGFSRAEGVPYDLNGETYKTEILFAYDGCSEHRLMMHCGAPVVFKDHVYAALIAHGNVPRIVRIPLDGAGPAKIGRLVPEVRIGDDAHKYFTLAVDKNGYIHLTGNMHGGSWQYWISERPEDISSFVKATGRRLPPGNGITYPKFSKDSQGNLYLFARASVPWANREMIHVGLLSVYDADTKTWRALGADIPEAHGGKAGNPVTVWEDNFENGTFYSQNKATFVESNGVMLFGFSVLNRSPQDYAKDPGHSVTDILYAWSRDGGKTLWRTDGSKVEWPVRAEAGPHQAEVLWSPKPGDPFPWLGLGLGLQLDWKDRPIIRFWKKQPPPTGSFRFEKGRWVTCPPEAFAPWRDKYGVLMGPQGKTDVVRLWDENHVRVVDLGHEIDKLDEDYLHETGTMIYKVKVPGGNRVLKIMRTTITRPESGQ